MGFWGKYPFCDDGDTMTGNNETYDIISNEDVVRYLYSLREGTVPVHSASRAVTVEEKK